MDYKERYNDALKRAEEIMGNDCSSESTKVTCQEIFPELREPELTEFEQGVRDMIVNALTTTHTVSDGQVTSSVVMDYNTTHLLAAGLLELAKKDMKEQMLKDAVEGEVVKIFPEGAASVHYQPGFSIGEMAYFCKADGLNDGDKVRIVALKAEE